LHGGKKEKRSVKGAPGKKRYKKKRSNGLGYKAYREMLLCFDIEDSKEKKEASKGGMGVAI